MMSGPPITLVGDGVENPWNARTMIDAAGMFGGACLFRDRARLAEKWRAAGLAPEKLPSISLVDLARDYTPIVACDNLPNAVDVYGFRLPGGTHPALLVGNERHGLAHDMQVVAQHAVQIPMASRTLNCLNVAAAAAVALYYLSRGGGGSLQSSIHPHKRRPELLMVGPTDHIELGSAIRSAGAFGWDRLLVEDRASAWFGCDRITRSEGRGAARRGRNPIRVVAVPLDCRYAFDEICVLTVRERGTPLHRARLAGGARQLIAIPDESAVDCREEDWHRLAREVTFVRLDVPHRPYVYHYRLIATIALAEIARQVGRKAPAGVGRRARPTPYYDSALEALSEQHGETVFLDDLAPY